MQLIGLALGHHDSDNLHIGQVARFVPCLNGDGVDSTRPRAVTLGAQVYGLIASDHPIADGVFGSLSIRRLIASHADNGPTCWAAIIRYSGAHIDWNHLMIRGPEN